MGVAGDSPLLTVEEYLALPDSDQFDRELHRGVLQERVQHYRGWRDAMALTNLTASLRDWQKQRANDAGRLFAGDIGVVPEQAPDTMVGIDVAYFAADSWTAYPVAPAYIQGVPAFCAEFVAPHDTPEHWQQKVALYLAVGVSVVWIVDPADHTVTIHRSGQTPVLQRGADRITDESALPGFSIEVQSLFAS